MLAQCCLYRTRRRRKKSKNKAEQQSEEEVTEEPHHEHDSPGSSNSKSSSTQQQQSGANLRSAATSLIVTASHLLLYLPALLLLGLQVKCLSYILNKYVQYVYRRIHCVISFYCVALGGSQQQGTVVNPVAAALCALIVYSEFLIHPMVLLSTSRRMRQEVLRTLKRHSPCCCW